MNPRRLFGAERTDALLRAAFAALAIVLALLSAGEQRGLRNARREMARWLESAGAETPAGFSREPDAARLRLLAARTALAAEISPDRIARAALFSPEEAEQDQLAGAERMAETARLAGAVLAERPAAWDAAMILGASTYLSRLQARDTRLFSSATQWEEPLGASLRLAPGKREPARFLAAAYLDVWPALSPRKRGVARGLVAEVFRNPDDLSLLIDRWLAVAGDRREAFALVPADARAWDRVLDALARRYDWPGWSDAWRRGDAALLAQLRRDAALAEERRQGGDARDARERFLSVLARARPDARYLDIIEDTLDRCPPGPVDSITGKDIAPLLSWALDRCLYGECALETGALKRLARFTGEPGDEAEATVAVLAGDLGRSTLLERRAETLRSEPWAPYFVQKAQALAARGRNQEAHEALSRVHGSWERRPPYWQARLDVARAQDDAAAASFAAARLADLARGAWPATAWTWQGNIARLELMAGDAAEGLALEMAEAPQGGAVVELWFDGRSLGSFTVPPAGSAHAARPALAVALPVRPGLHLLELGELAGGRVLPGAVRLR